ncbi:MAG: ABC transporter permease [Nitrospinota bacterium]
MNNTATSVMTLWQREIVRFYRDRSRVIGGLVPPIIFWFFIGSGLGSSFQVGTGERLSYIQYFFPGTLVLIFLFTAIFSTISLIEDKKEGFLQSVLVAPIPRLAIVLGKVLGAATLAFLQGIPFLLLATFAGIRFHAYSLAASLVILLCVAFILASIGFIIAWKLESTQGFHAIMNMALIPMWLLSGALFPVNELPLWLEWIVKINPLTYCVAALQYTLLEPGTVEGLPSLSLSVLIIVFFCAASFFTAVTVARKGGDL